VKRPAGRRADTASEDARANSPSSSKDKFLLIFSSVVMVTVLCGAVMGLMAVFGPNPQPPAIAAIFETVRTLFTAGALTIFGLLGARFTPPTAKF
jgi:uncharacterized YccA/Bax inhibitor family protein